MKLTDTISADDFLMVEDTVPVMTKAVGVRVYDYPFRNFFRTTSIYVPPTTPVVARIGAFQDYSRAYIELLNEGVTLIHTPEEYEKCSFLPNWYPLIADLTPKSILYESLPTATEVERDLGWPVFVKGERQTNKHKKTLSVIEHAGQFEELLRVWKQSPMLHWQKMVCREFVDLQLVEHSSLDRIQSSYEFRLFYWKQQLVGIGRYWYEAVPYQLAAEEQEAVVQVANEVARRLAVCFLVVDVAKTTAGKWIVIEVNDGQESGYAGNSPTLVWENIIRIEQEPGIETV